MKPLSCIAVDDSEVQLVILRNFIERYQNLHLEATFTNPLEAYRFLEQKTIDILLLDIDMPELSGLDLLKKLAFPPKTILITSRTEYALEAFELEAVDYLLKPPVYERFMKAIEKAKKIIEQERQTESQAIYIKVDGKLIAINPKDITYVEAMSDYILIHTSQQRQYITYARLKNFEEKLKSYLFFQRIHRSFIVNTKYISLIEKDELRVLDKNLPISLTYRAVLLGKIQGSS